MAKGPIHHSEGIQVAVGGTFFGIGWGGVLTLLIAAGATSPEPGMAALTDRWWYFPAIGLSAFFVLVSAWFIAGVYLPLLKLPQTALAREMAPDLRLDRVTILDSGRTLGGEIRVLFHLGFRNHGRGDVFNTGVTVVIPDVIRNFRCCDMFGNELLFGQFGKTSESLQTDGDGQPLESLTWTAAGLPFYGSAATPMYFLFFQPDPPQPVRVRVHANSSDLPGPIEGIYELDPRVGL
jgi:hypothetical protein